MRPRINVSYHLTAPLSLGAEFEIVGFTALLGRSGAGKTSLLKAIAGLLPATGMPWEGLPPEARPVGYLPQGSALFPHLSVLENAAFALRGPDRLARAQHLLDSLGIGHLAAQGGARISGGEAQRAALARALARGPELLLLDEPSAALDASTRDEVLTTLIDTIEARGIPALAATHDPAIAGLADWLVLLDDGRIIQQGAPREVWENPRTINAAKLLGYQNFWAENGAMRTIHAENVIISETGIPAVITGVRDHGGFLRIQCLMPETLVILVKIPAGEPYYRGQHIRVQLPPERVKTLAN